MKKSILTLSAIALVAMGISSCQKEEAAQLPKHFRASTENSAKTTLNSELYTEWEATDQIRVGFQGTNNGVVYTASPDQTDPTWADFSTSESIPSGAPLYAVYPASIAQGQPGNRVNLPAVQNSTAGSLTEAPMVADFSTIEPTDGMRVKFQNLCGVMKIHLQQAGTYISEIAVIADQQLRGTYTISYTDGVPALTPVSQSNANDITLTLGSEQDISNEGKDFYIYLPAGNYTNMMLRIKNSDGNYATKTCASVTINRNEIVPITLGSTMTFSAPAQLAQEAFYRSSATSITFHYNSTVTSGTNIAAAGSTPIYLVDNNGVVDVYTSAPVIKAPVDCANLFGYASNLVSIDFGNGFSTTDVTRLWYMFYRCRALTNLDLSHFNTSNVTNMSYMFSGCSSLSNLDLSSFNTSNVTAMQKMFNGCSSLSNIDLSSFNTSNVTSMESMFEGCSSLNNIDLSNFNTSNVNGMADMFNGCASLQHLDLSSFSSKEGLRLFYMFKDCTHLSSIEFNQTFTSSDNSSVCERLGEDLDDGCTIHCNATFADVLRSDYLHFNANKVHFNTTY